MAINLRFLTCWTTGDPHRAEFRGKNAAAVAVLIENFGLIFTGTTLHRHYVTSLWSLFQFQTQIIAIQEV